MNKTAKNENCILADIEKLIGEEGAPSGAAAIPIPDDQPEVSYQEKALGAFEDEDEEADEDKQAKTGFFARIFKGKGKTEVNKAKKALERSGGENREEHFRERKDDIPDFSGVFDDMEPVNRDDQQEGDYGRTCLSVSLMRLLRIYWLIKPKAGNTG